MAPSAPPLWKILSFILPLALLGIVPVLFFTHYPNSMIIETQMVSFFIVFLLLNLIIPNNPLVSPQRRLEPSLIRKTDSLRIYLIILLTEFFIFLLSHNFSVFAFNLSGNSPAYHSARLNWLTWLGLWAYFSTIATMQHYAHYHIRQVSFASGLLFRFKNTYLDIALRRILGFYNLGLNLFGIYLLITSVLFMVIEYYQSAALQHFHIASILFWGLFLFFSTSIQSKTAKRLLGRMALSNKAYLIIASVCCTAAISLSATLSQHFPVIDIVHNTPRIAAANLVIHRSFLFIAMFILMTPLFASIIVKHAENVSRKKLLLILFCLPNLFQLMPIDLLGNKIIFVALTVMFLMIFFRGKTTGDFMTGALPIPKQRVILPVSSYLLFPAACLAPFNFYLLATIIGPTSLWAITVTASLLSIILGTLGILSYFGKTYRLG